MLDDTTLKVADKVRVREESEDKFLIYHDERGYETNAVGAAIIDICQNPTSFAGICKRLQEVFDAPPEEIRNDTEEILISFVENKLLLEQ